MSDTNTLVITRIFDAPRELVWKMWTEPEMMKKWWGPKDFTAPSINIDFNVSGKILACMRGANAPGAPIRDFWSTGTYKEIIPMEKIVVTDSFADEQGNIVNASYYGMSGDFPMELLITLTFEEVDGGKTRMTLKHEGMPTGEMGDGAKVGWNQSFDKLEAALKG
jgi:uncharacterized protein YndB with AHSA1/START domain